jgi:DNA topoisomerase-1
MEDVLDEVAAGRRDSVAELAEFYFGSDQHEGLKKIVSELGEIDARELSTFEVGDGVVVRVGRYGPYVEASDGTRANVPEDLPPDELTVEKAKELLASPAGEERTLGTDPESGRAIVARNGRFGPYVTEVLEEDAPKGAKPRTASLLKSMQLETVTMEDALRLLALPRVVGVHPEKGEEITAQNGRYGPYLKMGSDSRSLESEEQLFTISVDEAVALYAQPKTRGGRAAAGPLKELGEDPTSKRPVQVKDGRFGPYVTDGEYNATLRKGDSVETITLERAAELLAEKRAKGPAPKKRGTRKPAAKKTAARKATSSRSAAKKTAAKKG